MGKLLSKYDIHIQGLEDKRYTLDFEGENAFFDAFEQELITKGSFKAVVKLNKNSSFIQLDFEISGVVELMCDRSLELFDEPIHTFDKYIYKFGDRYEEISDELEMIPHGAATINIAQHIYDFIAITIPMKRLHPRFRDEEIDEEGLLLYSTDKETVEEKAQEIDPRWAALNKLRIENGSP